MYSSNGCGVQPQPLCRDLKLISWRSRKAHLHPGLPDWAGKSGPNLATLPAPLVPLMLCSIREVQGTVVRRLQLCFGSTLSSLQRLNIPPCNRLCEEKKKAGGCCSNITNIFLMCSLFSQCSLHMKQCSCLCTYGEQHNKNGPTTTRLVWFCCSRVSPHEGAVAAGSEGQGS